MNQHTIRRLLRVLLVCLGASTMAHATPQSVYDFSFVTLATEQPLPLAAYRGQVVLVVNTASQCGFTGQYKGLEALYQQYRDRGFVIVGVPSDNFGGQEPGSNHDIATFCERNYGVTFPMTSKTDVVGPTAHPLYQWARAQAGFFGAPKWNFHKYLIGRDGRLITSFYSTTTPESARVRRAIERALAE